MNLKTKYMDLSLNSPFIVGSSGLTNNVENIVKCEKHGAGAVVLKSLFEEQILADKERLHDQDDMYFWYPDAVDYINSVTKNQGIKEYIQLIKDAKNKVSIPVIASINCVSPFEWPVFAKNIEDAGADGLELNIYISPVNHEHKKKKIEDVYIEIINEVKKNTRLPIAIKIGFFFTSLADFIGRLDNTGINGIVMFNRYFRPDIDIDKLSVIHDNILSSPEEMTISLRWVALMSNSVNADIAPSTGIHDHEDAIKQILCGASAVQVCSTLYKNGVKYLEKLNKEFESWMMRNQFNNIDKFKGMLSSNKEITASFERIHFMKKSTSQI